MDYNGENGKKCGKKCIIFWNDLQHLKLQKTPSHKVRGKVEEMLQKIIYRDIPKTFSGIRDSFLKTDKSRKTATPTLNPSVR
jgi:hypothetical protein